MDGFKEKIDHIRKLFLEGREYEADCWAEENLQYAIKRVRSYEYSGELYVRIHEDSGYTDYVRDIDLINGVCRVGYISDGVRYSREYFASYPSHIICCRYTADSALSASLEYRRCSFESIGITEKGTAERIEKLCRQFPHPDRRRMLCRERVP